MARLIGLAGHVDHGKTTLVQALTGVDTDRLPAEKERGMTIDLGFAPLDLPGVGRVSVVDVPGHAKFLHNMLVGALGTDVALLCVAADSLVMPQTEEHLAILRLLGVERLVVALTFADRASDLALAQTMIREWLEQSGYPQAPVVPVCAPRGEGIEEVRAALTWALAGDERVLEPNWLLPIDRIFSAKGHGLVVTGTLARGKVSVGDPIEIQPMGLRSKVRGLQSHGETLETAQRGMRVAVNLAGIDRDQLDRGALMGTPGTVFATERIRVQVDWLELPKPGSRVRISLGSDEVMARVRLSESPAVRAQSPALVPREPGDSAPERRDLQDQSVELRLERPAAAAQGQRLILRRYSPPDLLGGGVIIDPFGHTPTAASDPVADPILAAVMATPYGLPTDRLCQLLGQTPQQLGDPLEKKKQSGQLFGFAGWWMAPDQYRSLGEELSRVLLELHGKFPDRAWLPREKVLELARIPLEHKPQERWLARLVEEGKIRLQGAGIADASFEVRLTPKQEALWKRVEDELLSQGVNVQEPKKIALALNLPHQAVTEILNLAVQGGRAIHISPEIILPTPTLQKVIGELRAWGAKGFTPAEFRDRFETSRKYAIPILEYLDKKRVTERVGEVRVLREGAEKC